jgi:hypothetical protein
MLEIIKNDNVVTQKYIVIFSEEFNNGEKLLFNCSVVELSLNYFGIIEGKRLIFLRDDSSKLNLRGISVDMETL